MKRTTKLLLSLGAIGAALAAIPTGSVQAANPSALDSGSPHDWTLSNCGGGFHFRSCITVHGDEEKILWIEASYRAWEVNTNWDGHWSFKGEGIVSGYGWGTEIPFGYSGFTLGYVNRYIGQDEVNRKVPYGSDVCASLDSLSGNVAMACIAVLP